MHKLSRKIVPFVVLAVAGVVSTGPAHSGGIAPPIPSTGLECDLQTVRAMDRADELCGCETISRPAIDLISRQPQFPQILEYTQRYCPRIADILTAPPPAAIDQPDNSPGNASDRLDADDGGNGGGGNGGGNGGGGNGGGGNGGGGNGGGNGGGGNGGGGNGGGNGGGGNGGGGNGGGGNGGGNGGEDPVPA